MPAATAQLDLELERQTEALVELGYPGLADMDEASFRAAATALLEPLSSRVSEDATARPEAAPFVLVVNRSLVPATVRVPLLSLKSRPGTLSQHFADVDTFRPVVDVPTTPVYAVVGVERGDEFRGVRPTDAAKTIADRGRTMLTIEEGMAFLHACPDALASNHCFHTGASRGDDRRVPALWIAGRAPHLGWCWENNHHTWLGVASCAGRVETGITSEG